MGKGLTVPKWVLIVWLKIPQMHQNLSVQAQKFWISMKKRLHRGSVVRGQEHQICLSSFNQNLVKAFMCIRKII